MNKAKVNDLIARGDIRNALALLPSNTTEAIMLQSQYSNLEKSEMLGTLSTSEANISRNRIVNAILSFVDMQTPELSVTPAVTTNFGDIEAAYNKAEWQM